MPPIRHNPAPLGQFDALPDQRLTQLTWTL